MSVVCYVLFVCWLFVGCYSLVFAFCCLLFIVERAVLCAVVLCSLVALCCWLFAVVCRSKIVVCLLIAVV